MIAGFSKKIVENVFLVGFINLIFVGFSNDVKLGVVLDKIIKESTN